jgi:tetratricopeptide (TPR) repeat protein/TolB-like protein
MLAEYELELLSPEDTEAFELHLLECTECFEKVRGFSEESIHLVHSPVLRELVRDLEREESESMPEAGKPRRTWRGSTLAVTLAAAAVLVFLILQPWQIEIRPTQDAVAARNRIAIMPFANLVDEADSSRLGRAATSLLITDLSESRAVQVVSDQRMEDILSLLEIEGGLETSDQLVSAVADRSNARWVFVGSILQEEPQITVDVRLIDAVSGDTLTSERVTSQAGEEVFSMIDRMTETIRCKLLPESETSDGDRPVAEVTTHSKVAYRHYLKGLELEKMYIYDEAILAFERVVSLDSTFAMAWFYLAVLKDGSLLEHAKQNMDRASRRDQHYIRGLDALWSGDADGYLSELHELVKEFPDEKRAYYQLAVFEHYRGNLEMALGYCRQALEIDPRYKSVFNRLAYLYDEMGLYEEAIGAINKYIELVPDEPNPYDTRGDIYARNGRIDLAIESYRKALDIKPDFGTTAIRLGNLYLLEKQYDEAEHWFGGIDTEIDELPISECAVNLANVLVSRGMLDSALHYLDLRLDELATSYRGKDKIRLTQRLRFAKARVYAEIDPRLAVPEIEAGQALRKEPQGDRLADLEHYHAQFLAESGEFEMAEQVVQELGQHRDSAGKQEYAYFYAAGCGELAKGKAEAAVRLLEEAAQLAVASRDFPSSYMLSRAYLEAGQVENAVAVMQRLLTTPMPERVKFSAWNVKLHYYLGMAYEKSNWPEKAIEQYQEFLDCWQDADAGNAVVEDARRRLKDLSD